MKIGKLCFQCDMLPARARDISRTTRARAGEVQCLVHRGQNVGMLPHAEVIVAAPHCHGPALSAGSVPARHGKGAGDPLELSEGPVAAIQLQLFEEFGERSCVGHG